MRGSLSRKRMPRHAKVLLAIVAAGTFAFAQSIQSPEQFLGFRVGAEKKLARWDRIVEYMKQTAEGSDRIDFKMLGTTTLGNPFIMLVISSPENLKNIEHYKSINRRLFDPRTIGSESEARSLVQEGKLFLLITCSIHATEIGATQMSLEAVHRLATEDSPGIRNILDQVVFLLVPSLNPDGQIIVTDWYNKTLGTSHENAPLPWLYHTYVGHDNNRDAYMFTQKETRLIGQVLYRDWLPAVWLDEHQMGGNGPRIFVMPALDPINPNVDPLIYRNAGLLGFAQGAALEKAGKEGIIYGDMYTYWWEGAMAWAGWWHNMVGMLTEVASARIATPTEQLKADPNRLQPQAQAPERRRGEDPDPGRPTPPPRDVQFRSQYPRPWLGGKWSLRDIVDYELIATFGLLEAAANMRAHLLDSLYTVGKRQIEAGRKGSPYAIVVPADQEDRPTVVKLLQTLALGGVEIHQAEGAFTAGGKQYPSGTYLILMAQPFRAYAKDMLEPQVYPQIPPASGLPARPPYDVAGWSLGMQMGVETIFVDQPFEAPLRKLDAVVLPPGRVTGKGSSYLLAHDANNSLVAVNRLLKSGYEVSWLNDPLSVDGTSFKAGAIAVRGGRDLAPVMNQLAGELGIDVLATPSLPSGPALRLRAPRTALYQPWGGNMDEGWTRWLLEQYEFPFQTIHPEDVRRGKLDSRFDCIVFPDMRSDQVLSGLTAANVPDEYRGGIEDSGVDAVRSFVESGGTLVTLGQSCLLPIDRFAVPFADALKGVQREEFFCPGSVLRVLVDNTHPVTFGMKPTAGAYFTNSLVLEATPSFSTMEARILVQYPNQDILMSGWLRGESYLTNKVGAAEVRLGKGRMILLPLRVQHRAQPHGTFKLLFNSILSSAADRVEKPAESAERP